MYKLPQQHLNNCQLVTDREAMVCDFFPSGGVVAEVGVYRGEFALSIAQGAQPEELILVDLWDWADRPLNMDDPAPAHEVLAEAKERLKDFPQATFRKGDAIEVMSSYPDHYFDWVYLDTSHDYEETFRSLNFLKNKVKPGGLLAGHDYAYGNWVNGHRFGVVPAVHNFCTQNGWELAYFTLEEYASFALRAMQ
jgi:hypothetical protein